MHDDEVTASNYERFAVNLVSKKYKTLTGLKLMNTHHVDVL